MAKPIGLYFFQVQGQTSFVLELCYIQGVASYHHSRHGDMFDDFFVLPLRLFGMYISPTRSISRHTRSSVLPKSTTCIDCHRLYWPDRSSCTTSLFPSSPMRISSFSWLAYWLLLHCLTVQASSGDRSSGFQWCLAERMALQCAPHMLSMRPAPPWQTFSLRITRWTCEDDCKYQCAHRMTSKALASKGRTPVEQYYGKWAFWRLWGMQEPASALFSLLNFSAHLKGGLELRRGMSQRHPMKNFYLGFTLANLNLWVWSAVFHTRGEYGKSIIQKRLFTGDCLHFRYTVY